VLIATTSLAARIERAEAGTAAAFGRRAADRGADLLVHPIGGTVAVHGGPDQPFNKIAGLGFAPLDEPDLEQLETVYDARGADMRVEQSSLADPAVASMLTRRGFTLIGYENVLGLPLTPDVVAGFARERDAARAAGIDVAQTDDASTWIRTVSEGFLHPESFPREAMERIFTDFSGADGFVLYLARRGNDPAGGAALRMAEGLGQLAGAATLPAERRRGVQSALLRARLVEAAAAGCDLAVVTTEPASKSQANVQRVGFSLLYVRAVLVRAASTGDRSL
jgi:ribosomal protein S18 acetylase RimI-like enzyme